MQTWKALITCSVTMLVFGCASTPDLSPGNPLPGVGLGASGDNIMLSWSKDGGLAKRLRPGAQLQVRASYNTQFGPVLNEVVASNTVPNGFPGVKLKLTDKLQFQPEGKVCLRLTVGRQSIPLRIARPSESVDGFYYTEWAQNVGLASQKNILQSQLNIATTNVRNFSEEDSGFIQWMNDNNLDSVRDCENIVADTVIRRPETALQGQAKVKATAQQCIFLYSQFMARLASDFSAQANAYIDFDGMIRALQSSPRHLAIARQMKSDFSQYDGREYFRGAKLPMNYAPLLADASLGEKGEVSDIAAKVLTEGYEGCKLETAKRIESSFNDWQDVSRPQTVAARKAPLTRLCQARFNRESERMNTLEELKTEKARVESQLQALQNQSAKPLPAKKPLIPYACSTS